MREDRFFILNYLYQDYNINIRRVEGSIEVPEAFYTEQTAVLFVKCLSNDNEYVVGYDYHDNLWFVRKIVRYEYHLVATEKTYLESEQRVDSLIVDAIENEKADRQWNEEQMAMEYAGEDLNDYDFTEAELEFIQGLLDKYNIEASEDEEDDLDAWMYEDDLDSFENCSDEEIEEILNYNDNNEGCDNMNKIYLVKERCMYENETVGTFGSKQQANDYMRYLSFIYPENEYFVDDEELDVFDASAKDKYVLRVEAHTNDTEDDYVLLYDYADTKIGLGVKNIAFRMDIDTIVNGD